MRVLKRMYAHAYKMLTLVLKENVLIMTEPWTYMVLRKVNWMSYSRRTNETQLQRGPTTMSPSYGLAAFFLISLKLPGYTAWARPHPLFIQLIMRRHIHCKCLGWHTEYAADPMFDSAAHSAKFKLYTHVSTHFPPANTKNGGGKTSTCTNVMGTTWPHG